ncbi:lipopolysaccharide assembly protein LapA domain-containing protein [Pseudomonas sp. 210_17 TE3656]
MRNLKRALVVLFILALATLVLFFVLENQQVVALVMFGWSAPALPLSVVVLAALLLGLVVGPLMGVYVGLRAKGRARRISG